MLFMHYRYYYVTVLAVAKGEMQQREHLSQAGNSKNTAVELVHIFFKADGCVIAKKVIVYIYLNFSIL